MAIYGILDAIQYNEKSVVYVSRS